MAGLDPAIQEAGLKALPLWPWMAASEGGHGVKGSSPVHGPTP